MKVDWLAALLFALLVATLLAFFTGYFPYPFGWIVLVLLLIARISAMSGKDDN